MAALYSYARVITHGIQRQDLPGLRLGADDHAHEQRRVVAQRG